MNSFLALIIIFLVYSIGDFVADKTKAFVSSMLACAVMFTIGFWCGLPKTIFVDSGLIPFAKLTVCMFLIHIGTTIRIRDFAKEWKTVFVTLIATIAVACGVFFAGRFFMDPYYALVGAPVLAGGMVAYLVMAPIGDILARPDIQVFAVLVLVFQNFVGIPIASFFCKREGDAYCQKFRDGTLQDAGNILEGEKKANNRSWLRIIYLPEKFSTTNIILLKLAAISYISMLLGQYTGLSFLIYGLIFGVVLHEIGLLEEGCLAKANGLGFVLAGTVAMIFVGLTNTTPAMLLGMILPLIIVLCIGTISCSIVAAAVGRLVHFDWKLSIAMAVTAFFGFPATYLISLEVSRACGKTPEEQKAVLDYMMPKLVIAGIVSVSVVSGLIAGIMVHWI